MKNFLWTLYYYTYKFYTKILKEQDPNATTVWVIGMAVGVPISLICIFLCLYFFDIPNVALSIGVSIEIICVYVTYHYYIKNKRSKKIIKTEPYIKSKTFTKFIVICFYIFCISSFFTIGFIYEAMKNRNKKTVLQREWPEEDIPSTKNQNEEKNEEFSLDSLLLHL